MIGDGWDAWCRFALTFPEGVGILKRAGSFVAVFWDVPSVRDERTRNQGPSWRQPEAAVF